jgi:hypothetical protein
MTVMAQQQNFLDHVVDAERAPDALFAGRGAAGMAIYRNAYRARLISCLRSSYDKSWSWMGDARFDAAAAAHIAEHVSRSWSLDDYGANFPQTLASLFPDDPEIADLATLEWATQAAFVKPDAATADSATLVDFIQSGADIDRLCLTFLPSLEIFPLSTNAAAIWRAIADESEMPVLEQHRCPRYIIIWRPHFSPHFREAEEAEASALSAMLNGADFGRICRQNGAEIAGGWLGRWINDAMIAALH